jgi:hypothetical protein
LGELRTKVIRQAADHTTSPTDLPLLVKTLVPEIPVQLDELRVDDALSSHLGVSHTGFQPGEEVEVSVWDRCNGICHAPFVADP